MQVDGISDWNMGAIASYPANFVVGNIAPNVTYYVGVQGIGDSDVYSISASLQPHDWIPPAPLLVRLEN